MSIGFIIGLINKDQGSMSAEIVPLQQIRANLTGLLRRINPFWSIIGTAFISVCLFVFFSISLFLFRAASNLDDYWIETFLCNNNNRGAKQNTN